MGVYSWKNPGVSPIAGTRSSIGSIDSVDCITGTPVRAAARATCRSPWKSWEQTPMTPMGTVNSGVGSRMPNSSIERSRS